jgi:hypothetical protein
MTTVISVYASGFLSLSTAFLMCLWWSAQKCLLVVKNLVSSFKYHRLHGKFLVTDNVFIGRTNNKIVVEGQESYG